MGRIIDANLKLQTYRSMKLHTLQFLNDFLRSLAGPYLDISIIFKNQKNAKLDFNHTQN
jgi:hypothetical protein